MKNMKFTEEENNNTNTEITTPQLYIPKKIKLKVLEQSIED